jgi:hypothetical protein
VSALTTGQPVTARVVRGSEIRRLMGEVSEIRTGADAKYRADLREYNRKRRGRKEVKIKVPGVIHSHARTGYYTPDGPVYQPDEPTYSVWGRIGGYRIGDSRVPSRDYGLLANGGRYNRAVVPARVERYRRAMEAGEWHDCLTDPIAITSDGQLINGQHRVAAAAEVDWPNVANDPAFLVLADIDPHEIMYVDSNARTGHDLKTIAQKTAA